MTGVSDTPIWVVASYFLAWRRRSGHGASRAEGLSGAGCSKWRRPDGESLCWTARCARGSTRIRCAIRDLYGFLETHQAYYEGDASGSNVAIVYSMETLFLLRSG